MYSLLNYCFKLVHKPSSGANMNVWSLNQLNLWLLGSTSILLYYITCGQIPQVCYTYSYKLSYTYYYVVWGVTSLCGFLGLCMG